MYVIAGLSSTGRSYSPDSKKHFDRRNKKLDPVVRGGYYANGKPLHKTTREGSDRLERFFDVLANNKSKKKASALSALEDIEVGMELYKGEFSDITAIMDSEEPSIQL
jgi:hypothetical protein